MADGPYDGLNEEETRIVNEALQTGPEDWDDIAREIQEDLRQGKITASAFS